jgi:hypothetical protein
MRALPIRCSEQAEYANSAIRSGCRVSWKQRAVLLPRFGVTVTRVPVFPEHYPDCLLALALVCPDELGLSQDVPGHRLLELGLGRFAER